MIQTRKIIASLFEEVKRGTDPGHVASYIPELALVDANKFGLHISTVDFKSLGLGDFEERFSIQSIAKVISLSLAYSLLGESIWTRLGVEPSGTAFNSLVQLEADKGIPRNPFINAGALVICDSLITQLKNPKEEFLQFFRMVAQNPDLSYSERISNSEKTSGHRNKALCHFIKSFGNIHNEPDDVLQFYFDLCSIELSCKELSTAFIFLANGGKLISNNTEILNSSQTKRMNALMQTCGFYDESGEFSFKVGLPGKSGVGGGIIAIHPHQYAIAVWSPRLNQKGNSYKGMKFLEAFTTQTKLSIF